MPSIRPIILKGHGRPLTTVKFNRDGDLLFTCAKDNKPCLWWADNGERVGTYNGHKGMVWSCDVSFNSDKLLTGSADQTARLWEVKSGKELFSWNHKAGVRAVSFATGERMFLAAQDSTFGSTPSIFVYNLAEDNNFSSMSNEAMRALSAKDSGNINAALWGSLNQTIISASEDGKLRTWDVESGKEVLCVEGHKKRINNMQFSKDHTMIITASSDHSARLFDAKTLTLLKTFSTDRPVNDAAISPISNHIILGGGQEAMNVTTTSNKVGHFETDFFHSVYAELLGSVGGHFGPINTLAFSPTGRAFASGAEDGYVRLHPLEKEILSK